MRTHRLMQVAPTSLRSSFDGTSLRDHTPQGDAIRAATIDRAHLGRSVIALALTAALAGCGGADTTASLQTVANALNSAATALTSGNTSTTVAGAMTAASAALVPATAPTPAPTGSTTGTTGTTTGSATGTTGSTGTATGGTSGTTTGTSGTGTTTTAPVKVNSVETIIDDMSLPHEGTPIAFAGWGTLTGPGLDYGNNPPTDWGYALPWGVIFVAKEGSQATNTRVEMRNMRIYVLSKRTNTWRQMGSSTTVDGSFYNEDFRQGNDIKPATMRTEPGGGVSTTPVWPYAYHFWCCGRQPFDRADLGGVYATYQARLVVNDTSKPDDRAKARFLAYTGLDYWRDLTSGWEPGQPHNGEAGHGRMKYVTNNWRAINMTTVPAATLRANPPPME